MSDDLEKKIRDWLDKRGFPLELKAASIFQKAGFEVIQSWQYADQETGKSREIDVLAADRDGPGVIEIVFAIECKSTPKPWIILSASQTIPHNRLFMFAVSSRDTKRIMAQRDNLEWLFKEIPWASKNELTGYSLRQALSEPSEIEVPYAATMSVVKAANSLISNNQDSYKKIQFIFPLIVVNSPLFRCSLSDAGEVELSQIEEGEFLFDTRLAGLQPTAIRVINLCKLEAFAQQAKSIAQQIRQRLGPEEEKIKAEWHTGPKLSGRRTRPPLEISDDPV